MKRIAAMALAALLFSGCANFSGRAGLIDPSHPQITVTADNRLVVNQEPIIVPRQKTDYRVTWQLARDSRARFDRERGITVDSFDKALEADGNPVRDKVKAAEVMKSANDSLRRRAAGRASLFECRAESEFEYSCIVPPGLPHGLYAYTIRVTIDGKPFELDPRFML